MKSKENLIPAKRTNPDSNYAYAQEMEEDSVQQVENCLEDATLLTLQKAGAAYKDRIARKRELHKPHQEGSLYRNTLEPREKETVVREPSKTNPQGTSKQEQQRCTAQKQIEQQVKKVAREIRGVDAISVQEAVELLTEEYRDRLEEIENSVECDRQKIESKMVAMPLCGRMSWRSLLLKRRVMPTVLLLPI